MIFIDHRINTVAQLKKVPVDHGIELDIRYHEDDLVMHHDPFRHHKAPKPERFEELLKQWGHKGPMILNVKTEGVEQKCIDLLNKYNVKNWFFLDLSMPSFAIYAEKAFYCEIKGFSPDNLCVRFSEREALEYALGFSEKAGWVWIDCFTKLPLDNNSFFSLRKAGFKLCVVSPELQKHDKNRIKEFKKLIQIHRLKIDAVCTKYSSEWKNL